MLLIFLLFASVALAQNNPISATEYIGAGMDARTGIFGLAPIFSFTYSGKQWISPDDNVRYDVPNEITVSNRDVVYELVEQNKYYSYEEFLSVYKAWNSFTAGFNIGYLGMGFEYDEQLGFLYEYYQKDYAMQLHGTHWWNYIVATMYPPNIVPFDPMFQK